MANGGRMKHRLVLVFAGLMLGSCMEGPERPPPNQLATEANQNALRALQKSEELEARLERVEQQLGNRSGPAGNAN